jgi:predicted nucleotidyltransferase component of viral defense system
MKWFSVDQNRRRTIIEQTSAQTGVPEHAVEKDYWVSVILKFLFESKHGEHLLFKGGTSLSKAWQLIERFSEDIDLAISPEYLGFESITSKESIEKLRKEVFSFTSSDLRTDLLAIMTEANIPVDTFSIELEENKIGKEPVSLVVAYQSILSDTNTYVLPRVKIELSGRSLKEPNEVKSLNTMMSMVYPNVEFVKIESSVKTVLPQRTFLEKVFLLHEEFLKEVASIKYERLSRHLYDIHQIYSAFGEDLLDDSLFQIIKKHRAKFSPIKGTDYENMEINHITFLPPDQIRPNYEHDYNLMYENMIYGLDKSNWKDLMESLANIQSKFENFKL